MNIAEHQKLDTQWFFLLNQLQVVVFTQLPKAETNSRKAFDLLVLLD
jgi:hypothetical protein